MMNIVVNKSNGLSRVEKRNNKDYLVAPIVVLKEGVLNGRFVPAEEIERFSDGWNGRPVPVRHPKRGSDYVSANSLDILDEVVIGQFFNAHYDDGALKGDIWIDIERAKAMGGDAAQIVSNLQNNIPYEVSSAYWAETEPAEGSWNGIQYNGIDRKLVPDHVAILPDEVGACSWQNGCGVPRINSQVANTSFISEGVRFIINALTGKENKMKDQLIQSILAVNSKMPKDFLQGLDEETLKTLSEALTPEEDAEIEEEVVEVAQVVEPVAVVANASVVLPEKLESLVKEMEQLIANAKQTQVQEKTAVMNRILANAKSFTADELNILPIETLRKLETQFVPADYSGRGSAVNVNSADSEWSAYVKPEVK